MYRVHAKKIRKVNDRLMNLHDYSENEFVRAVDRNIRILMNG